MLVSVVMPAYNSERFIAEAIDSVLRQTHDDLELIVIDDGSNDQTPKILARYQQQDPRVRIISQENSGAAAARNAGIAIARSDWIAVMDSDDIMEPHRIERQLAFIREFPDLSIASALVTWIDEKGRELGRSQSTLTTDREVKEAHRRDSLVIISHPSCLIRREMIVKVGGYRNLFRISEDIDLFTRIFDAGGRILVQQEHLLRYRIHSGSVTNVPICLDSTMYRWIRQCSINRNLGIPEPSLEEFQAMWEKVSWTQRANQLRKDAANLLYNKATFAYSNGNVVISSFLVVGSSFLDPFNAPGKVWRKLIRPRLMR